MRTTSTLVLLLLFAASAAQGQEAKANLNHRFWVGGGYNAPTRVTGSIGIQWWRDRAGSDPDGWTVDAGVGQSGLKVSAGLFQDNEDGWLDLRGVVTRTWADPVLATGGSTYVGAEAGATFMMVRFVVGVAHRVAGQDGPRGTVFTGGIQLVYYKGLF